MLEIVQRLVSRSGMRHEVPVLSATKLARKLVCVCVWAYRSMSRPLVMITDQCCYL